jgi:hypothetical protein
MPRVGSSGGGALSTRAPRGAAPSGARRGRDGDAAGRVAAGGRDADSRPGHRRGPVLAP